MSQIAEIKKQPMKRAKYLNSSVLSDPHAYVILQCRTFLKLVHKV